MEPLATGGLEREAITKWLRSGTAALCLATCLPRGDSAREVIPHLLEALAADLEAGLHLEVD